MSICSSMWGCLPNLFTTVFLSYILRSLIEVDVGIMTACMPSFAKMLHHHLPPWTTLKRRLRLLDPARPICEGSKRNLVPISNDSRPTHSEEDKWSFREYGPYFSDAYSGVESELQCPKRIRGVKENITGTTSETFSDEAVYLEHGSQQDKEFMN